MNGLKMQVMPSGPCPAKIMIVGEAPGEQEVVQGIPFVGTSGQELSRMLQEAGIYRNECFLTNVARLRPPGNDIGAFVAMAKKNITPSHISLRDKMVLPVIADGLAMLKAEIEMCQPNVIIAFGNLALWALTGRWGITSWRGSLLETDLNLALDYKPKVIPTYHPAAILRQWSWRPIGVHDLKRAKVHSQTREVIRPNYNFVIRPNYSQAAALLETLIRRAGQGPFKLSIDIETRIRHIACIGLAWTKNDAICIPFMCVERESGYWGEEEEAAISYRLFKLLTHKNVEGVGQNFLYDSQYFIRRMKFAPRVARDTMIAQHCVFSNMPKGLDFLSSMYCDHHLYWKDEGKEWDARIPEDEYWTYNCKDAVITYEVDEEEQKVVDTMGLRSVHDFQQSLFQPVLNTMVRGIRVDKNLRARFGCELQEEISSRQAWIYNVLGYELNPKSPKQMQELFYGQLGQKPVISRKTGNPSCDDEALQKVAARQPLLRPLINKILEIRSLGVFFSTFINAALDEDGRLRCSFNIAGTETYRFSSSQNAFDSGLNLQNVPKGDEEGELKLPNVRKLFIPDPGYEFFDIDLDSADLRIVTYESDCKWMKEQFAAGNKPYVEVAKEYYRDPTITKHHKAYPLFKALCHGTNYLGTPEGLAARIGLGVHETQRIQKWYYSMCPEIKKWQDDLINQVNKRRMVQNVFGYRMYFFDRIEGTIYNQAVAWIPQSTVGCLINRAYVNLYKNYPEIHVLLQVHDSLAGQYPSHLRDWAQARILDCARVELPYAGSPLIIPVGIKTSQNSWGECD